MDYKIPLFAFFLSFVYRINVRRNSHLIVQQEWMRKGLSRLTGFPGKRIIVAPPSFSRGNIQASCCAPQGCFIFLYPSTPDCHKNFEVLCQASFLLEKKVGKGLFKTVLTVDGTENRYARWLERKFSHVESIEFHGFMSRDELYLHYREASCLVFPSRIETWGLPISEFQSFGKPMILADLPYAHESAAGAAFVSFFPCGDASYLSGVMEDVLAGRLTKFHSVERAEVSEPHAYGWDHLFRLLLA